MADCYRELEFDLPNALTDTLVGMFESMQSGALNEANLQAVEQDAQGVYQIFLDEELVYVGKTDADAGLGLRLARHSRKIRGRMHLDPAAVRFKAIRVFVFTVMDLEQLIIRHYRELFKVQLDWNNSGFGSNDPGRNRDHSALKDGHFDLLYPINLDHNVKIPKAFVRVSTNVAGLLSVLKNNAPYTIRFETEVKGRKLPHPDLLAASVVLQAGDKTVRKVLQQIRASLNSAWQVTALPGYVIVYKESVRYVRGESL